MVGLSTSGSRSGKLGVVHVLALVLGPVVRWSLVYGAANAVWASGM